MFDCKMAKKTADTIRVLSAEAIQKAKSGHPGMPLGCADYAAVLWSKYLRHDPSNPGWLGRDRFILSAGHGSMLIYSLLHLFNYGLDMEELKNFRQWGSLTPGHPELGLLMVSISPPDLSAAVSLQQSVCPSPTAISPPAPAWIKLTSSPTRSSSSPATAV